VLTQGLRTASIGVVIGLIASFFLTRYLQTLLFGIGTHDTIVFVLVPIVLLMVATLACYLPARRATTVDPIVALRDS
jgi:ABC-type antimicrobial peptide transport system permease subunit